MKTTLNEWLIENDNINILINSFLSFYNQDDNYLKIPENLIPPKIKNKFTNFYDEDDNVYSGNKKGINVQNITSWTSDYNIARGFAKNHGDDGEIYQMDKVEFKHRFNFVSMDLLYEYLMKNSTSREMDTKLNDQYNPESELVVLSIRNKIMEHVENNSVILITNKYRKFDEDIFNELDDEELYGFLVMIGNKEIGIVRVEDDIVENGIGYIFGLEVFEKNKGYGKKIIEKIFKTHTSQYSFVGKATKTSKEFWVRIGAKFDGDDYDFILNKSDFVNSFTINENINEHMQFNMDDKIKIAYNGVDRNKIYYDDKFVGWFGIRYMGDIKLSNLINFILTTDVENDIVFKNSIVFEGGFEIKNEYQNKGFGKKVISKIFNDNPKINNILLYALEEQNAIGFWLKIGGKIIFEEDGLVFFNLTRWNTI